MGRWVGLGGVDEAEHSDAHRLFIVWRGSQE